MIPAQVETGEAPPDTGKSQLAAAGQEFAGTRPRFDLAFALGLVTAEKDTLLATLPSNSESDFHLGLPASVSYLERHPQGGWTHLRGEPVVPLDEFVVVSGPVGDGIVHLEHAGVAGLEDRREAAQHLAAEGSPVDAFPEVQLLRGDLAMQAAPEVAVTEEVLSEDELAEFNLFIY